MVGTAGLRIPVGSDMLAGDPAGRGLGSTGSTGRPSTESLSEFSRSSKGDPCWLIGDEPGEDSLASV
jgi:hypothetical protein